MQRTLDRSDVAAYEPEVLFERTTLVALFFALLGFLSSAHRGDLLQSVILFFTFMSALADMLQPRYQRSQIQRSKNGSGNCDHFDDSLIARDHIHRFLHAELPHFGDEHIWSANQDHVSSARPMVWDFCASCVPRSILHCPKETSEAPSGTNHFLCHIPEQQFLTSPSF